MFDLRYEDNQHGNLKSLKNAGIKLLPRTKIGLIHSRDALENGAALTKTVFASAVDCLPTVH